MSTDAPAAATTETYAFQAEINQLLHLIINAFYSNKEIFLRELLSNASDACDKARFKALRAGHAVDEEFRIRIVADAENKVLVIEDTGIGMTKDELIGNLGTIAHSGTKAFMEAALEGKKDLSLIGQFGVGFYSLFLVAHTVTVISRTGADEPAYEWASTAGGSFTIRQLTEEEAGYLTRGTRITLFLKEDQLEFLQESRIREIVKKHSSFLNYPIYLQVEREKDAEVETDAEPDTAIEPDATDTEVEKDEEGVVENDKAEESEPTNALAPKKIKVKEWDLLNDQPPLWTLPADSVTEEQHVTLYKSLTADWEAPLLYKQFHVEGQYEFRGVLYCPRRAPFDMFGDRDTPRDNVKLYVRNVYIAAAAGAVKATEIAPAWLSFMKGVINNDNLPLNVSREMLQQSRIMKVIRKNVVKKAVDMFVDLAADPERAEDYATFYDNFSKNIKLGIYDESDAAGGEAITKKLVGLLRFYSTHADGATRTSLLDYVTRAQEKQTKIYYITGESLKQVRNSPFLERLKAKGYEVLFMVDPIDEYMMQRLREYKTPDAKDDDKTFTFTCITKDGTLFDETEDDAEAAKAAREAQEAAYKPLCDAIKATLEDNVEKVTLSTRISNTPAVLVTGQYSWSANMERIMKAQALASTQAHQYMMGKKTLEINPDHAIVKALKERVAGGDSSAELDAGTKDLIRLLYDTALLSSGFQIEDASGFVARVHRMIGLGLSLEEEGESTETAQPAVDAEPIAMEQLD